MTKNQRKQVVNPATAGVFGALIGAAAAFFSQKPNRDKVSKKVDELKTETDKKLSNIKKKTAKKEVKAVSKLQYRTKKVKVAAEKSAKGKK